MLLWMVDKSSYSNENVSITFNLKRCSSRQSQEIHKFLKASWGSVHSKLGSDDIFSGINLRHFMTANLLY